MYASSSERADEYSLKVNVCVRAREPLTSDSAHMGHARNYVNFDVLRRVMQDYFRYDVRFIMNVTDIDDKIVMRAHLRRSEAVLAAAGRVSGDSSGKAAVEAASAPVTAILASGEKKLGEQEAATRTLAAAVAAAGSSELAGSVDWTIQNAYLELAHGFEAEFMEDMRLLGVAKPDMLTRVSEYIEKIVTYIQTIVGKGFAYESNGSVYFDVPTFEGSDNHKVGRGGVRDPTQHSASHTTRCVFGFFRQTKHLTP